MVLSLCSFRNEAVFLVVVFIACICSTTSLVNSERNHDILVGGKTAIQLKLFDNAFNFFGQNAAKNFSYSVLAQNFSSNQWTSENVLVSRLIPDQAAFVQQPEAGIPYNAHEFVTFYYNTTAPTTTAFSVVVHFNGQHQLRAFIQPFNNDETAGYRNATLIDDKWNAAGQVKINYLVIRPITRFNPVVEQYSYTDDVVFIGHRGTGVGRRTDLPEQFLENTIAAFNYACSKGADMIELDVQLSIDKIPIIYHDFFAKVYLHDRQSDHHNISFKIPIKDISFTAFKKISTNFMPHIRTSIDTVENQSFETLENVLKQLSPHCGINVEIKYPQLFENLHFDGVIGTELNEYVDRILEVLFAHSGTRKIVITSFHADLCTMVQLKQNKFRVAFLTSGDKKKHNPKALFLYDPRATTIELGSAFVKSMNMKGLSLLTQDVLDEPNHIHHIRSRNLTLYLWGDQLNSYDRLMQLKKDGVNALIFDKLDRLLVNHTSHH